MHVKDREKIALDPIKTYNIRAARKRGGFHVLTVNLLQRGLCT